MLFSFPGCAEEKEYDNDKKTVAEQLLGDNHSMVSQAETTEEETTPETSERETFEEIKESEHFEEISDEDEISTTYVLNINSKKFHYSDCGSVKQMKETNKQTFEGTRDEIILMGYDPCKNCKP
jgi:hypothetical protein